MSTNHTTNYQLSQWVKSDKELMDDFNADNAKIDAALKAETDARAAAVAGLTRQVQAVPISRFVSGSYTGDGQAYRQIALGFRPKMVFVWESTGMLTCFADGYHPAIYGGMAAEGAANPALGIYENGLYVRFVGGSGAPNYLTNRQGQSYSYFALG